jgi:hypothetical protein
MAAIILSFEQAHAFDVDDKRREWAEIEAGYFFDDVTKAQRTAFVNVTASAALHHGHGSQAHSAAIDLARRQWAADTKDARELFAETVEWFMRHRELSTDLDDRWTALQDRDLYQIAAE